MDGMMLSAEDILTIIAIVMLINLAVTVKIWWDFVEGGWHAYDRRVEEELRRVREENEMLKSELEVQRRNIIELHQGMRWAKHEEDEDRVLLRSLREEDTRHQHLGGDDSAADVGRLPRQGLEYGDLQGMQGQAEGVLQGDRGAVQERTG